MDEKSRDTISNWNVWKKTNCSIRKIEKEGNTFIADLYEKQLRISMDKNKGWLSSIQLIEDIGFLYTNG